MGSQEFKYGSKPEGGVQIPRKVVQIRCHHQAHQDPGRLQLAQDQRRRTDGVSNI